MSLMSVFERLSQVATHYKQACYSDYKSIVVAIADGDEPDTERLRDILLANDKTVDDLQADIKLFLERRELRKQYEALPELRQRKTEAERQVADADRELEAAEQRHAEQTAPFYRQLYDINRAIQAGNAAMRRLYETCNDDELLAELERHREAARVEHERQRMLNAEIRDLQVRAESLREESSRTNLRSRKDELLAEAKSLDAEGRKRERDLSRVQKQVAKLQQLETDLIERMREV